MKLAEARGEFDYETNPTKSKEGGEPSLLGEDNNGINPFMNATTSHLVSHVKEVCLLKRRTCSNSDQNWLFSHFHSK